MKLAKRLMLRRNTLTDLLLPTTPAQWFDAADLSTITLNGSTVSQWRDKSGNNRHASQATPAAQPIFTESGLNGLPVVTFGGDDNLVHGYMRQGVTTYAASLFVVASIASGLTGYRGIFSTLDDYYNSSGGISMMARGESANWGTYSFYWQPSSSNIMGAGAQILEMIEISNGSGAYYRNGVADGKYNYSYGKTGEIGGITGQQVTGYIAEILYFETNLDVAGMQSVRQYLRGKWNL